MYSSDEPAHCAASFTHSRHWPGKTFSGKAGSLGRPSSSRPGSIAGQGGGGGMAARLASRSCQALRKTGGGLVTLISVRGIGRSFVGPADIRHNIAQERQVELMVSLKFARL